MEMHKSPAGRWRHETPYSAAKWETADLLARIVGRNAGKFSQVVADRPIYLPPVARSARRALRVTVPDGIILDSHAEADTRCNEYPARGPGGLRAGHRTRSPCATEDRHQGLLCVFDALRRSAEHEYVPRLPRSARCAAVPESPRCLT